MKLTTKLITGAVYKKTWLMKTKWHSSYYTTTSKPQLRKWTHVCVVAAPNSSLYVDGNLQPNQDNPADNETNSQTWVMIRRTRLSLSYLYFSFNEEYPIRGAISLETSLIHGKFQ